MNFVDDINFIAGINRLIAYPVQNFSDIINTGFGSGIELDNINMSVGGNRFTIFTLTARMNGRAAVAVRTDTIYGTSNQARGSGFTDSADSR